MYLKMYGHIAWQENTNILSIKATEVGMLMKCPIP